MKILDVIRRSILAIVLLTLPLPAISAPLIYEFTGVRNFEVGTLTYDPDAIHDPDTIYDPEAQAVIDFDARNRYYFPSNMSMSFLDTNGRSISETFTSVRIHSSGPAGPGSNYNNYLLFKSQNLEVLMLFNEDFSSLTLPMFLTTPNPVSSILFPGLSGRDVARFATFGLRNGGPVPEPAMIGLVGVGLAGLLLTRRKRARRT